MMLMRTRWPLAMLTLTAALAGCTEDKPSAPLAPSASALAPAKPAAAGAKKFTIDKGSSKVDFAMDAPEEKIVGHAPASMTGDLQIDASDVTQSTGVLSVDISGLEVFQTALDKGTGKFGAEHKEEKQNEHVRNWLEISKDTPAEQRQKNATLMFSIKSIAVTGEKDLGKLSGADRKVPVKVTGEFLLHGHKVDKVVDLEATFHFEGDKPVSVHIKSVSPFNVDLAEHDVRPRDAIGKLLAKGLDKLSSKVGKEAAVSIEYTANLSGA